MKPIPHEPSPRVALRRHRPLSLLHAEDTKDDLAALAAGEAALECGAGVAERKTESISGRITPPSTTS
jgi:hypothetical protein